MKLIPKSTLARCLWFGAIIGLIALTGPALIHLAYRLTTPLSIKKTQTERYNHLANAEASDKSLSEEQRTRMRDERLKLWYWFHSRGWAIDEDDEDKSWLQPWHELIRHWTSHQGANNTDAGNGSDGINRVLQLTSIGTGETVSFNVKESHYDFSTETLSFHVDEDTKLKMGTRFLKHEMQMRYNDFDCGKATVFGELGTHIGTFWDEAQAAELPPEVIRIGTPRNKEKSLDALDQLIEDNRKK